MKKVRKLLCVVLSLLVVLCLFPVTAQADVAELTVGTGGTYTTLSDAIHYATDGCIIRLVSDITDAAAYTGAAGSSITIDGGGYTLTGIAGSSSPALQLLGEGTVYLKNLTIQGNTGASGESVGLRVLDGVNVKSKGGVHIRSGYNGAPSSMALDNMGNGTVSVESAVSTQGNFSCAVSLAGDGTVNVTTANGTGTNGFGVYNSGTGRVNVTTATGTSTTAGYGVYSDNAGTVNVTTATGSTYGVNNTSTGVVNVGTASGSTGGISNTGGGTVNTGSDVTTLTLNKGADASCILDSITVAAAGDTVVGYLPGVYKNGAAGTWYGDMNKIASVPSGILTAPGGGNLYSSFYYFIQGTIYDAVVKTGLPARLQLKDSVGSNIGSAVTAAANGDYVIGNVPPGNNYTIAVALDNYIAEIIPSFNMTADKTGLDYKLHKPLTVGTGGYCTTLAKALSIVHDGETITLLNDLNESVTYDVTAGKTVTIDGGSNTITATSTTPTALSLTGTGTVKLKDLTLQGGTASGSKGLEVSGSVNVESEGTVAANGAECSESYGLINNGSGTVNVTTVCASAAGSGFAPGYGVYNAGSGTVNVSTATVLKSVMGGTGVYNKTSGTVNVGRADGPGTPGGTGVYNVGTGTVNAGIAAGNTSVFNSGTGPVNVGTLNGTILGTGTVNTGTSVAALTLNKGTGASCVLDSITVASTGSTKIGSLPGVYKNGVYSSNWYTDNAKSALFNGSMVTGATTLYGYFYTVPTTPTTPSGGGGGGGGAVIENGAATTTSGNRTVATVAATAAIGSNGSATASVTGAQMTDAIDKAVKGATAQGTGTEALVEIKVEGAGSATSVSTTIPQSSFAELSGSRADGVRISTPLASVTFDATALDAIKGKAAGDIKITAALANTSVLTSAEKEAVGNRPVYDLTVASGSTTISDFGGGSATVSIPYKLSGEEDADKIVIYYLSDSGDLVMVQNCSYDAATGRVTFIARHFSNYVIGYNNVSFSDVSGWCKDYVNYLAAREIINGTGSGKFNPNTNITRAQFVTILANLSRADLSGYTTSSFGDVSKTAWYSAAVQWAYEKGIVTGASGKFEPNANITRQDMAVMITRYAEKAADYTLPATNKAIDFTDSKKIGSYASGAVTAMQQAGIIGGNSDGSFAPTANASRAQAAKMIALLQQGMVK